MVTSVRIGFIAALLCVCGCSKVAEEPLPDRNQPKWMPSVTVTQRALRLSGRVRGENLTSEDAKSALVLVRYLDAKGKQVVGKGLFQSPVFKCGCRYLTAGPTPVPFALELNPPKGAVRAEIGFCRGWNEHELYLSRFRQSGGVETAPPAVRKWTMRMVSVWFLLFVASVFLLYFLMPYRARPWILLVASVVFYSLFDCRAFVFLTASAISIWLGGMWVEKVRKTGPLAVIVVFNIGILVAVKYLNAAVGGFCDCFDFVAPSLSIVLPLGVSFYTLQAVSYVWDVSAGRLPAERNFFKLFLYLVFFPTVMQGPISRYGQLGGQLWTPHEFDYDRAKSGLQLALWGFFKKMVIADRAALLVDTIFAPNATMEGFPVLLGVLCYSIQIYADFSGCVDICRGISEVFGIDLVENFRHPYFATSVKDFWRRWHISLSSWLKDYVYIPLGGNRRGSFRKYLNILIVFGVSGIWHGVGINFFIWGLLHGVYQIFDGLTVKIRERALTFCGVDFASFSFRLGQRIATFALVTFAWIFFRAPTLGDAWSVLKRLFVFNPWTWTDGSYLQYGLDSKDLDVLLVSLVVLVVVSCLQERGRVREMLARQTLWFRWCIYLLGVFATLIFGIYGPGYSASQFIYMQF